MSFRKKLYRIVDEDTRIGNLFGTFIILLIVANMLAIILESIKSLHTNYAFVFEGFENFCLVIFTFEYAVRLATADIKFGERGAKPFFKYMFSFMALVDLLAILPSLLLLILPAGMLANLQFIRMLRIMRIFRVLKITRYSSSLKMMGDVLKDKASDLSITIFIAFILMILASTLMYYAEHDTQPDQFPDIVHAFWWAAATLTTVGYGDVYPVTALGKILSGIIAILGIGLVALPTGILSSAFVDKMEVAKQSKRDGDGDDDGEDDGDGEDDSQKRSGETRSEQEHVNESLRREVTGEAGLRPQVYQIGDCPHAQLRDSGEFPGWMQYCPLCGKPMATLSEPANRNS